MSVGGYAYTLSRLDTDSRSGVFAELADKFVTFVDVLSEVSERTVGGSNADSSGSDESGSRLAAGGAAVPGRGRESFPTPRSGAAAFSNQARSI